MEESSFLKLIIAHSCPYLARKKEFQQVKLIAYKDGNHFVKLFF